MIQELKEKVIYYKNATKDAEIEYSNIQKLTEERKNDLENLDVEKNK